MPQVNFTLLDVQGSLLGSLLFLVFAFAPGYAIGWLVNAFSFRRRLMATRLLIAIALSISVSPILCYWIGWLFTTRGIWVVCAIWSLAAAVLLIRDVRKTNLLARPVVWIGLAALLAGWAAVAIGSLIDIQIGDRLYFPAFAHDYFVRTAMTDAISRGGVRPASPFFFPGAPVPLRYHHFWQILCSLVAQLGGRALDTRQAMTGGTVWSGIGLLAMVPLYLRFFYENGSQAIRRRSLIGVGLLAVTGLDLIPTIILLKFSHVVLADMDWWNTPIVYWVDSVLWVPHHVGGLVCCLTGFLLIWARDGRHAGRTAILAGLAFASAVGCSIYVSFVFFVFLTSWTAITMARRHYRESFVLLGAGLCGAALVAPHLLAIMPRAAEGFVATGAFVGPWIRTFRIAELLLDANHAGAGWRTLVHLLLLPLNYLFEFGFFFAIGILTWKRYWKTRKLSRESLALIAMAATSLLICTFLRSNVILYNDLGMRGLLVAQFVLLLWAVEFWPEWAKLKGGARITLAAMLAIGAAGTVYQVVMLRIFPILADRGTVPMPEWLSTHRQLGHRTMALRQAYTLLQSRLPRDAVIQNNPDNPGDDFAFGLYANRQTAAADRECISSFGGSPTVCHELVSRIAPLFRDPAAAPANSDSGLTALVFQDIDPVWTQPNSWIWRVEPLFENRYVRVIPVLPTLGVIERRYRSGDAEVPGL